MLRKLLKLVLIAFAAIAAFAGLSWLEQNTGPEYVEIYSDEDELF